VGLDPDLQLLLDRLARALLKHQEAERSLLAAAERVSERGDTPALLALTRCEVVERRARLHVEIARNALARHRGAFLDDQRRVPAAFRRVTPRRTAAIEMVGTRVPPAARPPQPTRIPIALPPRPHDRAAS
jgi:hypothetical protein